jgi:methylated-DNA-[protein]-cysteine S-methyltransferase
MMSAVTDVASVSMRSPVGSLVVTASPAGLVSIEIGGRPAASSAAADRSGAGRRARDAAAQLDEYFGGRRREFDLPLDLRGTPFQVLAWQALLRIPFGATVTYGQQAAMMGRPTAARAVGSANGRNPVPIVVPCHRVVAAGAGLGGYSSGLDVKRALLALEGVSAAG